MRQATVNKNKNNHKNTHPWANQVIQRLKEGLFLVQISLAIFLLVALSTYQASDPGWSRTGTHLSIANAGGKVGAWMADFTLYMLGYLAYLLPPILVYLAWLYHKEKNLESSKHVSYHTLKYTGLIAVIVAGAGLISLYVERLGNDLTFSAGGVIGSLTSDGLIQFLNMTGATLFLVVVLLIGVTWCSGFSWLKLGRFASRCAGEGGRYLRTSLLTILQKTIISVKTNFIRLGEHLKKKEPPVQNETVKEKVVQSKRKMSQENPPETDIVISASLPLTPQKTLPKEIKRLKSPIKSEIAIQSGSIDGLPSLDLLDKPSIASVINFSHQELEEKSREVELKLADFNIQAKVVAVRPGPVVTRYELELAPGIKVSKLTSLAKDLARSLSIISVRVVEVIPGKSVVGIELPNEKRATVNLREVLESAQYQEAHSPLSMALGKDIAGHPVIVDLAKMPHLLVAGTTGSGKSVGVNAMLMSLLFKATWQQVRLILVDPKMLELSIYDGIPHLLAPVVTDMKEAANALRWCVGEMERRYRLMASLGVRNLSGYNQKVSEALRNNQPINNPLTADIPGMEPEILQTLPYIVVMIDEFADMMMVVGKKVEQLIARIAQKARAAGIHLILATQRPSVDVITGLIKANIPTRISYQVSSKIDSRTILDQQGAEQLLGHGDLLYLAPGTGVPVRVHGAFVSDDEVHNVVNELKQHAKPDYLTDIFADSEEGGSNGGGFLDENASDSGSEHDALYDQAVEFVIQSRKASISSVQRRFKIGYNRAARLIEEMENAGIVTPMESNGSREVLVPAVKENA